MYLTGITYHLFLYSAHLLLPLTGEDIGYISLSGGPVRRIDHWHATRVGIATPR